MGLMAGAARLEITPAPGVELMGYGARTGVAGGIHDPLYARALTLRSLAEKAGRSAVVLVSADVCLITPDQALWVRRNVSRRTGLPPEAVLVSCTHTHSGPDTGLAARMSRREEPSYIGPLLRALEEAGSRAWAAASPARLRWRRACARIGRNRRLSDGPVDPEILVLEVLDERGKTEAVLYHYACHGTVLGHDNLEISGDWPGAASARIEEATGATALFVLGAHADIDPRTRGLMDLAISGQSRGLGFDAVELLGAEVAEAVLASLHPSGGATDEVPIGAAARSLRLPIHLGDRPEETARKELLKRKEALARWLGIATDEFPRLSELEARVRARAAGLAPSELREWIARARLYLRDRTGSYWTGGARVVEVEAQVLRIGEGAFLALPLEPTTQVGLDWKSRARSRAPFCGVAGIANGWLRYLPHPLDLAEPLAHQRYEILSSLLAPGACEKLLALGETLLDEILSS